MVNLVMQYTVLLTIDIMFCSGVFFHLELVFLSGNILNQRKNRRDGAVVRASASQSVDLGFIPLVDSYQKTLKWYPQLLCLALGI